METRYTRSTFAHALVTLGAALSAACSGSSGGSGPPGSGDDFQLVRISVPEGAVWEVNREIEFTFSDEVDFSTVSLNTIHLQTEGGRPATGAFFLRGLDLDGDGVEESSDPHTVVFQPSCPTLEDLSDAGLQAGGATYVITVAGETSGTSNEVRSATGRRLRQTQIRRFTTPASTEPALAFLDQVLGAPRPIVRAAGGTSLAATYLEIGRSSEPGARVYFEANGSSLDTDPPGFAAPLNLYGDAATRVAFVVEFNQPVEPSAANLDDSRLQLQFQEASGTWRALETRVTLATNCSRTGATVRLEPVGILPPASRVRAVVLAGFRDIVGQATGGIVDDFAEVPTENVAFQSLVPGDAEADQLLEPFLVGGDDPASFEDAEALFDTPAADWGGGRLESGFRFEGTGGPGGDFDWVVKRNETVFFDTTLTQIVGGPEGIPTRVQDAADGVVDVRDFIIERGATVRVQGPNPLVVLASREVIIEGTLDVSGFNAKDVATILTGNQVEVGGAGAAGGGRGGSASTNIVGSTPRGETGDGPFGERGAGGMGGESGFARGQRGKDARRPGGGGGARMGRDQGGQRAAAGFDGHPSSKGADTGESPARGGAAGIGPFRDGDDDNDFLGVRPVLDENGALLELVRGELPRLWAGYGGGGGGDAVPSQVFPQRNWTPASDEKGGGGGGGAGGLRIRALGRIVFGPKGNVLAEGGQGATGENTIGQDHVGGTGGSGSGGHVVLESATQIDFTGRDNDASAGLRDFISARGGAQRRGPTPMPPPNPQEVSYGGSGGPGIVQLHVPDPAAPLGSDPATGDVVVPLAATLEDDPLRELMTPGGVLLIPSFGPRSRARSRWISIGGADQAPSGMLRLVSFLFGGVETRPGEDHGKVLTDGGRVRELPPLLGVEPVDTATAVIGADGTTLRVSGASLDPLASDVGAPPLVPSNDVYLRTPALLRHSVLRLAVASDATLFQDFDVEHAVYDDVARELELTVDEGRGTLRAFVDTFSTNGTVVYSLIPRFFAVETGDEADVLPEDAFVRITFQAAGEDARGRPDADSPLVDWTADVGELNALAPGALRFFRFQVDFELDADDSGVSADTRSVALDFLRIPLRF